MTGKIVDPEVCLFKSERWSSVGGNSFAYRVWSFDAEKINSFASEFNISDSRFNPGRIPFYEVSEADAKKFIAAGMKLKKPIGLAEYEKKKAAESAGLAVEEKSDGKFKCDKCGGRDGWLPRAPGFDADDLSSWWCADCKPSPNESIVAKRCGPRWEASEADRLITETLARENAAQEIVVAVEAVACVDCKGMWVIERPTPLGVEYSCWTCGKSIDKDVFSRAVNSRPRWRILQEARKLKASARMDAVRNGSSQELAGKR